MWVPGTRRLLVSGVVALVLCQSVLAAVCKTGCPTPNKSTKYNFKQGSVYAYDVDSYVQVQVAAEGAESQQTTVKIEGKVEVYVGDNCQYTLRVLSLTSFGPDGKKTPFGAEIGKPVQFTLSNDELSAEICTESDDTDFSVNIKRGIVSLFQSAQDKSTETDVFGVCQTTFSSFSSGGATVVNKIRDLNGCAYRESLSNGFVSGIVNSKAGIQAVPLLNGNYNAQQTIKNGALDSVKLSEEYQFVPFAKATSGVQTKVTTKLQLTGTKAGAAPAIASADTRTIIFENPEPQTLNNLATIKQELKTVVDSYAGGNVGKQTGNLFTELIHLMRYSKKEDLLSLHQQVKAGTVHSNKSLARKVYLDALFRVGTGDAVEAIAQLYKSKEINNAQEQRLAFLSLNLVNSMTKDALKAVGKLLDGNPPREAYLSVGTLVSKFCQKHGCQSADVRDISNKFAAKLGKCQATSRAQEDLIVATLKGVRNSNNLVAPLLDKVTACAGSEASSRIRVAAFQAFPAASCNKKVVNFALNTLKDVNEDSEIRIQAYLSLVECPSATVASELKALLDAEKVYQVGSYITTHLASLRASADPTRSAARAHFGNIRTSNKFPMDFRRYSFNREFSYAVESLGVGAGVDTSVIYSQKSFLPKSVAVNFTGELFGRGVNVLEIEGRQDNLEHIAEHYFGPKGFFRNLDAQAAYDTIIQQYEKMSEKTKGRFRRGIREDIRALSRNVKLNNDALKDFNLDVSVKLFGSELFFLTTGDNVPTTPEEFLDKFLECFDKVLEGAKKFDRTFEQHGLFLDTDLVYPTAVGLPLKLTAQGAGVVRLDTSIEVDVKEIVKDYKNAKFSVKLQPSGSYEVTGTVSVDAFNVLTGVQVIGTAHSATGANVKFALHDASGYDLTIDSLQSKQELFSVATKSVFITRERGNQNVALPLKHGAVTNFRECFDNLYNVIGVTVCAVAGKKEYPGRGLAPVDGDYNAEVYLEVEPKFHFSGKLDNANPRHVSLEMRFDTPGSQAKRLTTLKLEGVTEGDPYVKATLESPIRNVDVQVGFNNNEKEAALYALAHNGPEEYLAKIGFQKGTSGSNEEYVPIFTVRSPTGDAQVSKIVQTTGKIVVERMGNGAKKYNLQNIQWTSQYAPKTTIQGYVVANADTNYDANVEIAVGEVKNNIVGHLDFDLKHVKLDLEKKTPGDADKNFQVKLDVAYTENSFRNVFAFVAGKDFNNPTNRYELNQNAEFDFNYETKKLNALKLDNKLQLPKQQVRLDFASSKNLFKLDGEYGYDKYKIAANVDAKYNEKAAGDYDVQLGGSLNKHFFKFNSKRIVETVKSRFTNRLTASTGTKAELNGMVTNRFTEQEGELNLEGLLIAFDKASPYKLTVTAQLSPASVLSNGKVLVDKDEFATYDVKYDRGQDPNGKFTFTVKNFLDGNGEFKSAKGQGDGTALINFVKQERKLKVDTKFRVSAPVYDVTVDFFYDFEKDNSKKVHFDTKNKATQTSFDSKNKLEIFSEKYEFNVQGQGNPKSMEGNFNSKFSLTLPTGRQLSGDFKRELTLKNDKRSGNAAGNFFDKLPGGKQRSLQFTAKLKDADFKAKFFDAVHSLKYTDLDGKTVVVDSNVKHAPSGHFKTAFGHIKVAGSLLPQVTELNVDIDEYCNEHAVYRVGGKYGGDFSAAVSGKYHVGGKGKPHDHELKVDVAYPSYKLGLASSGKFLEPETEDGVYDFEYNGSVDYNGQSTAVSTNAKGNLNRGSGSVKLNLPNVDPIAAEASYTYDGKEDGPISSNGAVKLSYGQGKTFEVSGSAKIPSVDDVSIHATLKSDIENVRNVDVTFKHVKVNDNAYNTKVNVVADGKKYSIDNAVVLSETAPSVDFGLGYPGKTVKVYGAFKALSLNAFKAETKIQNVGDFNMDGNVEANFQSYETFYFKAYVDAPLLNAKKANLEINAKPGASGKGVTFKASSDGKDILSGYADYSVKEQGKQTIIEGQGNVKLYEKQQSATFRVIREKLANNGIAAIITASVGKNTISHEARVQPNDFKLKSSLCDENKKCTNVEVVSKLERAGEKLNHEALISVELQQLGFDHEFGLTAKTTANGYTVDHTTDVQLKEKSKPKYQYQLYFHPTSAGAVLTLPTRTVAFEGVFKYPKDKLGKYDSSVSLFLDKKNEPDNKATLGLKGEVKSVGKTGLGVNGALVFSHPTIKALAVRASGSVNADTQTADGSVVLDIFKEAKDQIVAKVSYANNDQSFKGFNITTEVSVASKGLGFDSGFNGHSAISFVSKQVSASGTVKLPLKGFSFSTYLFATPEAFDFLLNEFEEDIVRAHGAYDSKKNHGDLTATIKLVPNRPFVFQSNVNGFTSAKFSLNQGDLFSADGSFAVDKAATLRILGEGKPLLNAKVTLDASHFLSTEYKVEEANAKAFLQTFQQHLTTDFETVKQGLTTRYTNAQNDLKSFAGKAVNALPDFKNFKESYARQVSKLQEDIMSDPTLAEFVNSAAKLYGSFAELVGQLLQIYTEAFQKISHIVTDIFSKLAETFNTKVLPILSELTSNVTAIFMNLYEETVKMVLALFERTVKALKVFEEDFNKIANNLSELFKTFAQTFTKSIQIIDKEFKELYKQIQDYFESFDEFKAIKETLHQYLDGLDVYAFKLLKELLTLVEDLYPVPEIKDFTSAVASYVDSKVKKQNINDVEEFKKIFVSFIKALNLIFDRLIAGSSQKLDTGAFNINSLPTFVTFRFVPYISSIKFSPFNYLRNEKLYSVRDFLTQFRPYAWNPFAVVPPFTLRAEFANGGHFFTFDDKHFTFPGSCQYLLASDLVDGNFSIVANLDNGKLKSISVVDKDGTVELTDKGIVKFNGKETDLPIHQKDIFAYRNFYTVTVGTEYGAHLMCTTDLGICHFTVSGFYHGKLRGLLGNGNHEPHDDQTAPSGVIVESSSEFGNAYKTTAACAAVADHGHGSHEHSSPACAKAFGSDSSLRLCYYFKDKTNYREACEHAVHSDEANAEQAACNIAFLYASSCRLDLIPVSVPAHCTQCSVEGRSVDVSEKYTVKAPNKQADVVVVVDTSIGALLGELVQATINELRRELKSASIADVRVSVIGYNKNNKYTSLFSNGGKLDYTGKLGQADTSGPQSCKALVTGHPGLNEVLKHFHDLGEKMKEDLGLTTDAVALRSALTYPFRPSASKSVLAIRSDSIELSSPTKAFGSVLALFDSNLKGINVNIISPVKNLGLTNSKDQSKVRGIVGFNNKVAYSLNEKKRILGSTDTKKTLKYDLDLGAAFIEQNGGNVFVLQNFAQQKAAKDKKQFVSVVASVLAEQISRTETVNECYCHLRQGLHPESSCVVTETKQVTAQKKPAGSRG